MKCLLAKTALRIKLPRSLAFLAGSALLVLAASACGDDPHDGNAGAHESAVVGIWEEQDPDPGYESFMLIEADGNGFWCKADGKSEAAFDVMFDEKGAVLGDYDFGGGDELTVSADGSVLTLVGEDHGATYEVKYKTVASMPDWCKQQIDGLRE
jgi:hypothetical protein